MLHFTTIGNILPFTKFTESAKIPSSVQIKNQKKQKNCSIGLYSLSIITHGSIIFNWSIQAFWREQNHDLQGREQWQTVTIE